MRYYKITNYPVVDNWCPRTFHIATSMVDSQNSFTQSKMYLDQNELTVKIEVGATLDFTLASFSVPVVSKRCSELLNSVAASEFQMIPVVVREYPDQEFFVLNTLKLIAGVVDECRSIFERWQPSDGRPDKIGKYRSLYEFKIDGEKCGGAHIFRQYEWSVALIVSEIVVELMTVNKMTGADYTPLF